jgi:Ribonuclease G/E
MLRHRRLCGNCGGTGRIRDVSPRVRTLEREASDLKYEIAELTERFGLDLQHRTAIPGEIQARKRVGERQIELATRLEELQKVMTAEESSETTCPDCSGTGLAVSKRREVSPSLRPDVVDALDRTE